MTTAPSPVKSQPLHNFSLPFLKWGGTGKNNTNTTNHQRSRRPPDHASSEPDSEPDSRPHRLGSRTSRNRFGLPSSSSSHRHPLPSSNQETDDDAGGDSKRYAEEEAEAVTVAEEIVQKPWNLRPRKPMLPRGAFEIGAGGSKNNSGVELQEAVNNNGENHAPKSLRLRGFADTSCAEKKEKRKFWIALSKDEIEEDIFVMTGSRPNRRPRKRPKNVQKQMDSVFPGLWLVGITADAYRVADTPTKR
ncbi:unnamed protein product [Lathyrus oleraceus]|uniref:DUF1639 family protein n=1 Tax=Pisum sativum TaxID=3888 RepID=A0A9D4XAK4_PEA|nr:uncharacterized protein LOC127074204 [Pisum sativum]KAI5417569.1 hypothetical protein KIW84_042249 [Pisum sativum]